MIINYDRLRYKCHNCESTNIEKTDIYKQALINTPQRYKRKELRKYVCKNCGEVIWI